VVSFVIIIAGLVTYNKVWEECTPKSAEESEEER
jgi:hypothetical protein